DVVLPTPPFPDVTTTTLPNSVTLLFQSSATTRIVSPSSQAWIGRPRRSASMASAVLYRPSIARSSASILLQKIRAREFPVAPAFARPGGPPRPWTEPPATISAPEATGPTTLTSPLGKATV